MTMAEEGRTAPSWRSSESLRGELVEVRDENLKCV